MTTSSFDRLEVARHRPRALVVESAHAERRDVTGIGTGLSALGTRHSALGTGLSARRGRLMATLLGIALWVVVVLSVVGGEEHLTSVRPRSYFGELGPLLMMPRRAMVGAAGDTTLTGYSGRLFCSLHPTATSAGA